MSSLPPPMPSAVAPPPMAYPPLPTPSHALPIVAQVAGTATDYGPVGTPPTAPGVLYFPESASNKNAGAITIGIGVVMMVVGLCAMALSPLYALAFLVVGGVVVFLGWKSRNKGSHYDYILDGYGFTLRISEGKVPKPPQLYPWSKVTGLDWTTRTETSRDDDGTTRSYTVNDFHLRMQSGSGYTFDESRLGRMKGLMEFIDAHTPQLSYRWLLASTANGLPVQARVGKYVRVPR